MLTHDRKKHVIVIVETILSMERLFVVGNPVTSLIIACSDAVFAVQRTGKANRNVNKKNVIQVGRNV